VNPNKNTVRGTTKVPLVNIVKPERMEALQTILPGLLQYVAWSEQRTARILELLLFSFFGKKTTDEETARPAEDLQTDSFFTTVHREKRWSGEH
jgi:hypothetical protein